MLNEVAQIEVLGQIIMAPTISVRQDSEQTWLLRESVRKIFKVHKCHPCKLKITQELGDGHPDKRIEFCEIMTIG